MDDDDDLAELEICPTGPRPTGWVPSGPYRNHLRDLLTGSGLPWRAIALYADVPARYLRRLAGARPPRRVPYSIGRRLLAVPLTELEMLSSRPGRRRVTSRRIRRLLGLGLSAQQVAAMIEATPDDVTLLARDRGWCPARTELLARAGLQAWFARYPAAETTAEAA